MLTVTYRTKICQNEIRSDAKTNIRMRDENDICELTSVSWNARLVMSKMAFVLIWIHSGGSITHSTLSVGLCASICYDLSLSQTELRLLLLCIIEAFDRPVHPACLH